MDCRTFRDKHALYVDQRCSAYDEDAMRAHARACPKCARLDTAIRRSLLLVRNLPAIQPSADFRARLEARLRSTVPLSGGQVSPMRPGYRAFLGLAAGVAFVTYLGVEMLRRAPERPFLMAPVVASLPESGAWPVASPAFVATVPTGMSVWPAIMLASQAPMHFVAAEMSDEH